MKKVFIVFFLSFLFGNAVDVKFNYKIDNDEFLYKKRIMEKELLNKDFNYITSLKSYIMYNELISSNAFIHFKLKTASGTKIQQFLLMQNLAGTPSLYEIVHTDAMFDFNQFMTNENINSRKTELDLPSEINYDNVSKFLNYSYRNTLKFIIRNRPDFIERRINNFAFYLTLDSLGNPLIKTEDALNNNINLKGDHIDSKLFSFSEGLNISKRTQFRQDFQSSMGATEYIGSTTTNLNKNLGIKSSPAYLGIIEDEDDYQFNFTTYTIDANYKLVESIDTVEIIEFFIVKGEIQFVED